ncbi:MAG TPA: four helix bundle protein [Phycisphaerales bacterium]|nr:four helix bundle protein [Phycisphaerales bacterium]
MIAWQKARVLRKRVADMTRLSSFRREWDLVDQMRRSARSIMANIAEGFDKHSRPEFHRFLGIAKGSSAELRSDLYAAVDDGLINDKQFQQFYALCEEVACILGGLRSSLRRSNDPVAQ